MSIAITGGSGFIGSHIAEKLAEKGHSISIIDVKRPHKAGFDYVKADIIEKQSMMKALEGAEYIYHLAAVSNVDEAKKDPVGCYNTNVLGTLNVLEAARKNDAKRVIFASTVWVYSTSEEEKVDETTHIDISKSRHIYTSSKIAAEFAIQSYKKLYGLDFTILRYGIPYGPRARPETVIPIFVRNALEGKKITIFGDGKSYRNFIYVGDLAEGNVLAMKKSAENKIFNLDGSEVVTIKGVLDSASKISGKKLVVEHAEARDEEYKGRHVSIRRAEEELGWKPKTSFEEGMKRYVGWARENMD
ncbi:epimerase [Candidatus Woesearchaeota archaeon CG10_big_fil_rev_8_21_14_0_10_44_13]|nr:MAG: epimerase [Candidatus Woesearchaeota archaeon CG10_big_fil_rev_8_21_14_0_10_44_13]